MEEHKNAFSTYVNSCKKRGSETQPEFLFGQSKMCIEMDACMFPESQVSMEKLVI